MCRGWAVGGGGTTSGTCSRQTSVTVSQAQVIELRRLLLPRINTLLVAYGAHLMTQLHGSSFWAVMTTTSLALSAHLCRRFSMSARALDRSLVHRFL